MNTTTLLLLACISTVGAMECVVCMELTVHTDNTAHKDVMEYALSSIDKPCDTAEPVTCPAHAPYCVTGLLEIEISEEIVQNMNISMLVGNCSAEQYTCDDVEALFVGEAQGLGTMTGCEMFVKQRIVKVSASFIKDNGKFAMKFKVKGAPSKNDITVEWCGMEVTKMRLRGKNGKYKLDGKLNFKGKCNDEPVCIDVLVKGEKAGEHCFTQ